jgi:hypothetical protein
LSPLIEAQDKRSQNLFEIQVDRKHGFIDAKGNVIIQPTLEGVYAFSEGLAVAYVGKGQFDTGYIDEAGNIAIEPKFNIASKFSEGLAWAGIDPNRKPYKLGKLTVYTTQSTHSFDYNIGFIDRTGKWIVEPIFKRAGDFSEGLAVVQTKENKFGFIDKTGKFAIEPRYEWAGSFHQGLAPIFTHGRYGFINTAGKLVIKPRFTRADDFSEGLACVKLGGQVREPGFGTGNITITNADTFYAYINQAGKVVFRVRASNCAPFSEGLARFESGGNWGFVNRQGKVVIDPKIDALGDFSEGLALVLLPGKEETFGFINKNGEIVIRTRYSVVDDFKNGLAQVRQDDPEKGNDVVYSRYGYIDKNGNVIWNPTR